MCSLEHSLVFLQFFNAGSQFLNAHTFMKLSIVFMALNSIQHIHRITVMSTKPFSEGWIVARKGEYSAYKIRAVAT